MKVELNESEISLLKMLLKEEVKKMRSARSLHALNPEELAVLEHLERLREKFYGLR